MNPQNTNFNFAPDDFVICCGDVSGDRLTTEKWIQDNLTIARKYLKDAFILYNSKVSTYEKIYLK